MVIQNFINKNEVLIYFALFLNFSNLDSRVKTWRSILPEDIVMRLHIPKTFLTDRLFYIHQNEKITPKIAAKFARVKRLKETTYS